MISVTPYEQQTGWSWADETSIIQVINHNIVWEQPISDLVIKAVEKMATEQGIKNIRLERRNKVPIFPANWIAEMDYEDNNRVNKKYNEYVDKEKYYEYDNELEN